MFYHVPTLKLDIKCVNCYPSSVKTEESSLFCISEEDNGFINVKRVVGLDIFVDLSQFIYNIGPVIVKSTCD